MHLNFSTNGYISNDGIYSNRAIIDTFTEKERYYFAVKYLQLDGNNLKYPILGARVMSYFITKDQFRKEGKTYYTLDKNRSYVAISNSVKKRMDALILVIFCF